MSLIVERFIQCDVCGEMFGVDNRSFTTKQHREGARKEGWTYTGGKDWCAVCSGKEKKPVINNPKYQ